MFSDPCRVVDTIQLDNGGYCCVYILALRVDYCYMDTFASLLALSYYI